MAQGRLFKGIEGKLKIRKAFGGSNSKAIDEAMQYLDKLINICKVTTKDLDSYDKAGDLIILGPLLSW